MNRERRLKPSWFKPYVTFISGLNQLQKRLVSDEKGMLLRSKRGLFAGCIAGGFR